MVPADSDRIPRVPPYSGYCYGISSLRVRAFHTLWINFPVRFHFTDISISQSYNPAIAVTITVWANSISLATTLEITVVFFSSAYLDVSVQRVRSQLTLSDWPPASRVAPFGNPRINSCLLIPTAYRSLPRPSSPPRAQAFPRRPYLLSSSFQTTLLLSFRSSFLILNPVNERAAIKARFEQHRGFAPLHPEWCCCSKFFEVNS